jgi:hypothetical protein
VKRCLMPRASHRAEKDDLPYVFKIPNGTRVSSSKLGTILGSLKGYLARCVHIGKEWEMVDETCRAPQN